MVGQYGWKGLVGCSITKAVARGLGVHTSSFSAMDREVGAILQSCLPHNNVITLIHTEAAGYAELAYDEEEDFNQVRRPGFGGGGRGGGWTAATSGIECQQQKCAFITVLAARSMVDAGARKRQCWGWGCCSA